MAPSCARGWAAESPTHALDGIVIFHAQPLELVKRVRAWERVLALLANRAGSLPVGHPVMGIDVDGGQPEPERPEPAPTKTSLQLPSPTDLGPPSLFQGEPCSLCGGFKVRTGTCETCQTCGTTSGCS